MTQEIIYIAVRSETLSKAGDARYVIKNRETHEVVDDNQGRATRTRRQLTPASHSKRNIVDGEEESEQSLNILALRATRGRAEH